MDDRKAGTVVGGLVLVGVGLALLVVQFAGDAGGSLVLTGLGLGFLVAHGFTRRYGLLVPGGVLAGLGVGLLAERAGISFGEPVLIGLGAGFVVVWGFDALVTRSGPPAGWWPLIPGGILLFTGVAPAFGSIDALLPFGLGLAFVVAGAVLLIRGLGRGEKKDDTSRPT
ncbi:MAG: hypothetical protein OEV43_08125 [Coriobacteriia bacterium]|nr:hypothetical protein [Coriobacteriia bacterium]